jgi:nucleotide-binding universal stress UspA family protein
MSYKTVLVHVDDSKRSALRVQMAAEIARMQGAHLVGAAVTGVSRFIYKDGNIQAGDPNLIAHLKSLRERAERTAASFEQQARELGIASFESVVSEDEAGGGVGMLARYCDLVVVGQTSRDEPSPAVLPDFPEYLVMHAGRPVLIVPYNGDFTGAGKRIVVAWDASREAVRAVHDALPLLKRAEEVHIALFNPQSFVQNADSRSGDDLAEFLARHQIPAEISAHQTHVDVGNALLSLAKDLNRDMIIMGAYGHSRFREMIMGGVTRTVLASMTVPILMSH